MFRVPNPYFAGPPATQPETFFGRQDVLRFVDDTLSSPRHNAIVLYGQRRIGKTSILHQIARRKSQDYHAIFFDLQSSVDNPARDLLYGLAREISSHLDIMPPTRDDFANDPEFFRNVFLPHVYKQLNGKRLLFLLDEFDALSLETAPAELDAMPFVQALNRIIQSEDRQVVFLFVVGRRLKDLSANQLQIFRGALDRQVSLLDRESCVELITHPAKDTLSYSDAALEKIWSLTSGHPYFTQLICHKIFNEVQRKNDWIITQSHVEAVVDDAISTGQTALQWFWNEVPPVERFTFYTIAQLTAEDEGASLGQLLAQRDLRRVQVPDIELKALPDKLVDRQVLTRDQAGLYSFAVEIVCRWIAQNHSWEEVTSELTRVAVDESAKDFYRAGLAAYQRDDYDYAIDSLSRALSINPDYVEARLCLARTRLKAGALLAAIDEFIYVERYGGREAKEARVDLADARAQYGQELEVEGKVDEAREEYKRVLTLDEQHLLANARLSDIYRRQADVLLETDGISAAQPVYEQAFKHKTDQELERKINKQLEAYAQAQEQAYHWKKAEQARQLATQFSQAQDEQEALLRTRLEWGRWLLSEQRFEEAGGVYRRLLEKSVDVTASAMIENDLIRYSQQAEQETDWLRVQAALELLTTLFPDDIENKNRLVDSLCRQGEFYLGENDFDRVKGAYRRALEVAPVEEPIKALIREGFQAYGRNRRKEVTVESLQLWVQAMLAQVEILGRDDVAAYESLVSAREALGDVWYRQQAIPEAHEAYLGAWDDATFWLQLGVETERAYRRRAEIGLKLGQVELDRGAVNEAADTIQQTLNDARPDQQMAGQVQDAFYAYRSQQEGAGRWDHARIAMEVLAVLFPNDEDVAFSLAEARAAQSDWYLQRAIPDLESARRHAQEALEVGNLSFNQRKVIVTRVKTFFQTFCESQQNGVSPKWTQAEWGMNILIGLLPGDEELHRQLAELRTKQGDWYLAQAKQSPESSRSYHLVKAAEAYTRAVSDYPNDEQLLVHLKDTFATYRAEHLPWRHARPAIEVLSRELPADPLIQQWLAETEPKSESVWKKYKLIPAGAVAIILILLGGLFFGMGVGGLNQSTSTDTPDSPGDTPTIIGTEGPGTEAVVVVTTSTPTTAITPTPKEIIPTPTTEPAPTATPSPTSTPTPTPTPTVTVPPTFTTTPLALEAPTLLFGEQVFVAEADDPAPQLRWRPNTNANDQNLYTVEISYLQDKRPVDDSITLTATAWGVPFELFHNADPIQPNSLARQFEWRVVQTLAGGQVITSESRIFTWQPQLLPAGEALDIQMNPGNPLERLVLLKNRGIYRTDNGGISWQQVANDSSVKTLHISSLNPKIIYAGVFGHILRSEDGGQKWEPFLMDGTLAQVNSIATDPSDANTVFAATDKGVVAVILEKQNSNLMARWIPLNRTESAVGPVLDNRFYSIVVADEKVYAVGDEDRVFSRDLGDLKNPWKSSVCTPSCATPILSLIIVSNDVILVGSSEGRLAKKVEPGNDWEKVEFQHVSLKTLAISELVIDSHAQIIYAGTGTSNNPKKGEGLYVSFDIGTTWKQLDNTVGWDYIQAIALDPEDTRKIYIAGSAGVHYSPDRGNIWISLSNDN